MEPKNVAYLRLLNGPRKGGVFVLKELSVFEVGRASNCQVLLEDPSVSYNHGRFYRKGDDWIFYDLNSDSGSSINDIPVDKRQLDGGEIIRVGEVEMHFGFSPPQPKASPDPQDEPAAVAPEELSPMDVAILKTSPGRVESVSLVPVQESPQPEAAIPAEADLSDEEPPQMRLRVIDGADGDHGKELILDPACEYVIGRAETSSMVLADGKVSRLHIRIEASNGQFLMTDLNSANGTILNGQRIKTSPLKAGDYLRLGFTVLTYDQVPVPA